MSGRKKNVQKGPKPKPKVKSKPKTITKRKHAPHASGMMMKVARAPTAFGSVVEAGTPRIRYNAKGGCFITHRELAFNLLSSSSNSVFYSQSASINPGLSAMFPWLAGVANNFEQYRFHKLQFHYITRTTTTTTGDVYLAIDYDASDTIPSSEQQVSSYTGVVSGSVWSLFTFVANKDRSFLSRYVRQGAVPTGTDVKTYDVGNLIMASVDVNSGSAPIGKVWVEYTVELINPQSNPINTSCDLISLASNTVTMFSGILNNTQTVATGGVVNGGVGYRISSGGALNMYPSNSTANPATGDTNYLTITGLNPNQWYKIAVMVAGVGNTYNPQWTNITGGAFAGPISYNQFGIMSTNTSSRAGGVASFQVNNNVNQVTIQFSSLTITTVQGVLISVWSSPGSNSNLVLF